jgi:phosphomannomutase
MQLQNGSDIRGVALQANGEKVNLNAQNAYDVARAFARFIKNKYQDKSNYISTVGNDSRITGPMLKDAVLKALADEGFCVYDASLTSTPAIFMSAVFKEINADCGIMITASHLPYNRNGMKFFTKEGGLDKHDIKSILLDAETESPKTKKGIIRPLKLTKIYSKYLTDLIKSATGGEKPLSGKHIIVDAGNGSGGFFADILKELGADTSGSIYLEPDGYFPNHIPNPENAKVMEGFSKQVLDVKADLGIIFDTDVDRAAFVDKTGRVIAKNALVALMSYIVSKDNKDAVIVTDSVTSDSLTDYIKYLGCVHHRYKRGYKNVIDEAVKLNGEGKCAPLAIETSGHCAMAENHFLDDGAYMAVKILILFAEMSKEGKNISDTIKALKEPAESVEIRMDILEENFKQYGQEALDAFKNYAQNKKGWHIQLPSYEGIRIKADDESGNGWALMRLSLHDPKIVINIESDKNGGAEEIKQNIFEALKMFDKIKY